MRSDAETDSGVPFAPQGLGMSRKKRFAQRLRATEVSFSSSSLIPAIWTLFFARDRFLRHGRVEQYIGENVGAELEIRLGDIER